MSSIFQAYHDYVQDNKGCKSWHEYYNLYVSKKWHRGNKQRNYKRNKDIIYKTTSTKRNGSDVEYEIIPVQDGDFYLDYILAEQVLKLKYEDKGYNSDLTIDRIRPFNFITMWVDDEMNLVADVPNLIIDAEFKIDNNGNLTLKYG